MDASRATRYWRVIYSPGLYLFIYFVVFTHIHTCTHTNTCTRINSWTHTHTHTREHTHTHNPTTSHANTYINTDTRRHRTPHPPTHAHIHAHTHTHTYTYIGFGCITLMVKFVKIYAAAKVVCKVCSALLKMFCGKANYLLFQDGSKLFTQRRVRLYAT